MNNTTRSAAVTEIREERGGDHDTPPLLLFTPIYPLLVLWKHTLQGVVNEHLAARNGMQIEIAKRMFPDTERQVACLYSEVCRKRTGRLLKKKPWLVSCYLAGLQDFVIGILTRGSCDRCRLKKQPPSQ